MVFLVIFGLLPCASAQRATLRPLTPFAGQVGNGCQTQSLCAAIERLGLYAGLRLDVATTDSETGRELAFGGTLALGLDLIRRVALEASFPVGVSYRGAESTLLLSGPLRLGGRLRLGGAAPTLFSERPQPPLAWVLGAYVTLPLPSAAGDERHGAVVGIPQPEVQAAAEIRWGPVQLVPSLGALLAERAVYLQAGGRVSLSISQSLRFDLEAQSRIGMFLPEDAQSRCGGGTRVGLGLRGRLGKGVMGTAHYDHGSGDCETEHRAVLGVTLAFGEEPLRHLPTAEEAGIERLWLGLVDPVLDCNGWMLDEATLMPKFKFGDPDAQDPGLIRRGEEESVGAAKPAGEAAATRRVPLGLREQLVGCVLGLVVGDAVGVPVEFKSRAQLDAAPVTDMTGFGTYNQPPGTWSDDSSLALSTAESLLAGYDPLDMMRRFHAWLTTGAMTPHDEVFDVGIATRAAIARFARGEVKEAWGGRGERDNGNGSLMRIAPLSLAVHRLDVATIVGRSVEVSALTHAHARSTMCCAYLSLLLRGLLGGQKLRDAMAAAAGDLQPYVPAEEREALRRVLDGSVIAASRAEIQGSGYVVHCLEASLWAAARAVDYREAVLLAVNLGDDTDTTAAVTGAICGAMYGTRAIPEAWLAGLVRAERVRGLAERLAERVLEESLTRHG